MLTSWEACSFVRSGALNLQHKNPSTVWSDSHAVIQKHQFSHNIHNAGHHPCLNCQESSLLHAEASACKRVAVLRQRHCCVLSRLTCQAWEAPLLHGVLSVQACPEHNGQEDAGQKQLIWKQLSDISAPGCWVKWSLPMSASKALVLKDRSKASIGSCPRWWTKSKSTLYTWKRRWMMLDRTTP